MEKDWQKICSSSQSDGDANEREKADAGPDCEAQEGASVHNR